MTNSITFRIRKNLRQARFAVTLAKGDGMPRVWHWTRLGWFYGLRKFSLSEIIAYDLARTQPTISAFVSKQESLLLLQKINSRHYICLTEDKLVFDAICRARNLPIPRLYGAVVARQFVHAETGNNDQQPILPNEFVAKPANGVHGQQITVWRLSGKKWSSSNGETLDQTSLITKLRDDSTDTSFILQERLFAHPDIEGLSGFRSVQTVRVVTYRETSDPGSASILFCTFRVVGNSAATDNFAFGHGNNIICAVDIRSGVVRRAWRGNPNTGQLEVVDHHPDSGNALEGFQIPFWGEALALVQQAADIFYALPTVGWDVAITPSGAVLIEGNATWDPPFADIASRQDWERLRALAH